MSQWKNIGPIVALSITAAFAGTGCLAQSADEDEITSEPEVATAAADQDEGTAVDEQGKENVGQAEQAWWGGFGGLGCGLGCGGFGGCGLGFGGCGLGFGGCGLGFGGCGLGFGGCGLGFGGCGFGLGGCGGCW